MDGAFPWLWDLYPVNCGMREGKVETYGRNSRPLQNLMPNRQLHFWIVVASCFHVAFHMLRMGLGKPVRASDDLWHAQGVGFGQDEIKRRSDTSDGEELDINPHVATMLDFSAA